MAITFISSTSAVSSNGNGFTTPAIDTTGANFLVATTDGFNAINPIGNVSDSKGNTWINLTTHHSNGGNVSGYIAYVINPTVGSGHTFGFGTTLTFGALAVAAYAGVDTSSPFDVENGTDDIFAATGQPGSITPGFNNELVISAAQYLDGANASVDSGFTLRENQISDGTVTHTGCTLADLIQTSAIAENPTWSSNTGSARQFVVIASFKAASVGATNPSRLSLLGVG